MEIQKINQEKLIEFASFNRYKEGDKETIPIHKPDNNEEITNEEIEVVLI